MRKTVFIIIAGVFAIGLFGGVVSASRDRDDDHQPRYRDTEEEWEPGARDGFRERWIKPSQDVANVQNETYRNECGDCHFAFQAGLLPATAWTRIMDTLENHYGDDATVGELQAREIRQYLLDNAADKSTHSRSQAFAKSSADANRLPRITTTRYFQNEHHEITPRMVQNNPEVGSFSNCQACHTEADAGIYNEHQVHIPGFGSWED